MLKVMILNSGVARRLAPLTNSTHKCLMEINNKTILERQIEIFISNNISHFIITTGPFEEQIKELIEKKFPAINVEYVHNPKYETTNYIYSMWLARHTIQSDTVLLHGDLVFDPAIIPDFLSKDRVKSKAVIDSTQPLPEKDFKALIKQNQIKQIGVNITGENIFFMQPLYYLSKKDFLRWMQEIDQYIKSNKNTCYAEDAFNEISDEILLYGYDIKGQHCMEVDTIQDLELANQVFKN